MRPNDCARTCPQAETVSPVRFTADDRQIFRVAVPALFALISEPMMILADTAIVGHLGTAPLAGLAIASTVVTAIVGLCIFLAYGSTAAVARSRGAGDHQRAHEFALSSLWLAGALGAVVASVAWLVSVPLTDALASSAAVAAQGHAYLAIVAAALPAMLLTLAATGALRGEQDLRTPLVVTVVANAVNIGLNLEFVYGLGWGIRGSALGTTLASWAGALWLCGVVARRARRSGARIRPHPAGVRTAARDGVPLFARTVALRLALFLPVVIAGRLGDAPLAAHQVATAVVAFLAYGLDALAIAGQTLTGHALGSGDTTQARRLSRRMMMWGLVVGLGAAVTVALSAPLIARLFTPDRGVQSVLLPVLVVVAVIQPVSGVVFVLDGILIGAGDGPYLARAGFIALVVYAPLAVALSHWGFTWLWVAYGGFMAARLATLMLRERSDRWMVSGGTESQR
jgi:putative MATE family efflux protein